MRRAQGATLAEIMELTGWQPHTVRGFVRGTLIKKLSLNVEVTRLERPPTHSVHRPRAPAERDLRFAAVSSNDRPSLLRSAFDPV